MDEFIERLLVAFLIALIITAFFLVVLLCAHVASIFLGNAGGVAVAAMLVIFIVAFIRTGA